MKASVDNKPGKGEKKRYKNKLTDPALKAGPFFGSLCL